MNASTGAHRSSKIEIENRELMRLMTSYSQRLNQQIQAKQTPALVGLDPRWDLLPEQIRQSVADRELNSETKAEAFERFSCGIIDVVAPLVSCVKPQVAFFEQLGPAGMKSLQNVIRYARKAGLLVIADAKRGDIGSTAEAYAEAWLAGEDPSAAVFSADALTVNAYLGQDTLQPFIKKCVSNGAGLYVLVRTSNPGAVVFQDRKSEGSSVFEAVADVVQGCNAEHFSGENYGSIGAVVGATWPAELNALRSRMPNTPLLVPGYGSQGGTAEGVAGAFDQTGLGAVINSSRAINFAHRNPEYADRFSADQWQEAVQEATKKMVEDLPLVSAK
ncbi:MAG: orotidine-5'-phosphate decarboxylase [Fuerstiella sp.]